MNILPWWSVVTFKTVSVIYQGPPGSRGGEFPPHFEDAAERPVYLSTRWGGR